MESLETLQGRISSFGDLRSIVTTMKALSAVSVRQYEQAVRSLAEYHRTVELGLNVVVREAALADRPERTVAKKKRDLAAIVFGSDHGMCGRFNEDISSYTLETLQSAPSVSTQRRVLVVGVRAAALLEQAGQTIEETFLVPGSASRITATVQQILLKIDEWRSSHGVEYVYLFYNRHVPGTGCCPTDTRLLPVIPQHFRDLLHDGWPSRSVPTFTMDRQQLLASLLRQYFLVSIFRACAESQASEHSSRLAAMQAAEKNLDERLEEVSGQYRRRRQDAITCELLDVVGGFESMAGLES